MTRQPGVMGGSASIRGIRVTVGMVVRQGRAEAAGDPPPAGDPTAQSITPLGTTCSTRCAISVALSS
nr:hypothetical protein [Nitrosovibrio tenuis]